MSSKWFAGERRANCAARAASLVLAFLVSGCVTIEGAPTRLYTAGEELEIARALLPTIKDKYDQAATEADRVFYRNEYIAWRMYVIDVEYSEYEVALTRERQEVGFGTQVAQQGLNTAGAVVASAQTTRILSGLAGAVGATRGFYDSEIVVAKTIQIAQGHMRAQRDTIAKNILAQRLASATIYPLSAALTDLEDYYRAGTLTSGLIEAVGVAGQAAQDAKEEKVTVLPRGVFAPDETTARIRAYYQPNGVVIAARRSLLNACLAKLGQTPARIQLYLADQASRPIRLNVIQCARAQDPDFPAS